MLLFELSLNPASRPVVYSTVGERDGTVDAQERGTLYSPSLFRRMDQGLSSVLAMGISTVH